MKEKTKESAKTNFMKVLVILGIIILPLVYSFFYLKAFWDPYNTLDQVPVAVVNLDDCSNIEGDCQGEKLVEKLLENGTFDFQIVDEKTADTGLVDENYYAVIKIPENFTVALNSAAEKDKIHPVITYAPNTKSNYLASQLISVAVKEVKANVQSAGTEKIVSGLSDKLLELPDQLSQIGDTFVTFSAGASELAAGVDNLSSGIGVLYTNYQTFDAGLAKVNTGAAKLKAGSEIYAAALAQYQELATKFSTDMASNFSSIITYANNHPEALADADFLRIYTIARTYTTPLADYGGKTLLEMNVAAANGVTGGYAELAAGINELAAGTNTLANNSAAVLSGLSSANDGSKTLAEGVDALKTGLETAQTTIAEKAAEATDETGKLDGLAEYTGEIVSVETKNYGDVNTYGTFFAPYFISLSLWVGGILILMGLYYDTDGRFKILSRNSNNRVLRLVFYNVIGIVQAILLGFLLKLTLGFPVTNLVLYYGSCILISEVFLAIVMFLFFAFKDVGKFLSIVLLVIQLAACGGTFPVETEPAFYQAIYPFMPMTYSVDLLRESFVNINADSLGRDLTVLIVIFAIFTIAIFLIGLYKNLKSRRLASS